MRAGLAVFGGFLSSALLACCSTSGSGSGGKSAFPPEARRAAPPGGLEQRALAAGAQAPDFTLPSSAGGTWTLSGRPEGSRAVLVFYRGHW